MINRDSTFLALAGTALSPAAPPVTRTTCCNPLGRKRLLVQHEPQMRYAAAVTICALTVKLRDDAEDERGLRRQGAKAGKWLLRRAEQKARTDLEATGFPVETVARTMSGQEKVEAPGAALTVASAPTALAYGAIFGHLPRVTGAPLETAEPLTEAGAALGRLIYTVDAWEDYEADKRRRRFNPLPPDETERSALVAENVNADLGTLSRALSALPMFRHQSLLTSLAGPRLQQRTLTRLGMAGPPPMPPPLPPPMPPEDPASQAPAPPPQDLKGQKKSGGCSDWCVGCPGYCCCGSQTRGGSRRGGCCDGIWCCPVPGDCNCPDCDCNGCDGCDCPCDC